MKGSVDSKHIASPNFVHDFQNFQWFQFVKKTLNNKLFVVTSYASYMYILFQQSESTPKQIKPEVPNSSDVTPPDTSVTSSQVQDVKTSD